MANSRAAFRDTARCSRRSRRRRNESDPSRRRSIRGVTAPVLSERVSLLRRERQAEAECASVARCAVDPHASGMRFDDATGDREAEADAATVARPPLPEALEQSPDLLLRETGPSVRDMELSVAIRS